MKRLLKILKVFLVLLILVILMELLYIFYICFFKPSKSIYFDSINSFEKLKNGYVAVGSNNNNEKHLEKAKIAVYDDNGERLIEKIYNKGYNSSFFDVVYDDGAYIAVGSYEEDEEGYEQSARKALIVKYDKEGNVVFDKVFGSLDNSKFLDVVVVDDGYLVVGQSVYDSMSIGLSKDGGAFLIKYSKFGKEIWRRNFGNNKESVYNSVLVEGDYIYAVGMESNGVALISRYSSDGNLLDSSFYNNTDSLGFTSIIKDDYIYVSGASENGNGLIVKYNEGCNAINSAKYEKLNSRFNRIMFDSNNDIVVIGSENKGTDYDGLLVKYSKDLGLIKAISYGEDSDDYFTDVILEDKNYLVSGYSSYEDGSYLSKFITYSDALKVLEVK